MELTPLLDLSWARNSKTVYLPHLNRYEGTDIARH